LYDISLAWNSKVADKYSNGTEITDISLEDELNKNRESVNI